MSLDHFIRLAEAHRHKGNLVVPICRRLSADLLTPVSAFLAFRKQSRFGFLLESVEGGEKLARYSFLGKNPYRIVRAFGPETVAEDARGATHPLEGNIFEAMQREMDRYTEVRTSGLPPFVTGAVGYLGYDAVRLIERLPDPPPDDLRIPDAVWCFYDSLVAFDHVKRQLVLIACAFVHEGDDPALAYARASERMDALEKELSEATPCARTPYEFCRKIWIRTSNGRNSRKPSSRSSVISTREISSRLCYRNVFPCRTKGIGSICIARCGR